MPVLVKENGTEEMTLQLGRFISDSNWVKDNYPDLIDKYSEHYIAVLDKEVIAYAPTMEKVLDNIGELGIDPNLVIIKFLTKEEVSFLL